jgi:hypothetical protein
MDKERHIETFTTDWQGIALLVSCEVRWLSLESANAAHLQIESVGRLRLPITETGYRSHFVAAEEIAQAGGPVAYALAWLDYMGRSKEWKAYAEASRQLSLF